jgi:hypothetical protein
MNPSTIVAVLLEDDQEDPKDFVQRTPRLKLHSYFTGTDAIGRSYRTTSTERGYFTVSISGIDGDTPYVGLSWESDTGVTGGFGQVFVLRSNRDIVEFLADFEALEKAVTVDGNTAYARTLTNRISSKTDYSRPHGYADPRGRS